MIIGAGCQGPSPKNVRHHHHGASSITTHAAPELHAQARGAIDRRQAVKLLSQAREQEPASGVIALDLGATLLRLRRYGEAQEQLQDAAVLIPESPWPHYNLGWLYHELGQLPRAAQEYETALELAPEEAIILENLILVYTELGTNKPRRIELIDRALLADPDPGWQEWLRLQRALLLAYQEAPSSQ